MVRKNLDLVWENIARIKKQSSSQQEDLSNTQILISNLTKLAKVQGETLVIKLSCDVINSNDRLAKFAGDVALLRSLDMSIVIVHDYNEIMPEISDFFGIREKLSEISKVLDYRSMYIFEMLVSGYLNRKITSAINAAGAQTVGISGKDCNLIQAKRFNIVTKREQNSKNQIIDMSFIGEPMLVNPEILIDMEGCGIVTVLSPIAYGENGRSFLLDANMTAAIISSSMSASRLIILSDRGGLKKADNIIAEMTLEELKSLKNHSDFRKEEYMDIVDTAVSAIENYTEHVHVIDSNIEHGILLHLFSNDPNIGTLISMVNEPDEDD
jgi:acetylglutamate kinase